MGTDTDVRNSLVAVCEADSAERAFTISRLLQDAHFRPVIRSYKTTCAILVPEQDEGDAIDILVEMGILDNEIDKRA